MVRDNDNDKCALKYCNFQSYYMLRKQLSSDGNLSTLTTLDGNEIKGIDGFDIIGGQIMCRSTTNTGSVITGYRVQSIDGNVICIQGSS